MEKYIMALDQGTTSSRCIIYNHECQIVSVAQQEFTQIYPKPGWVEHDPLEIWDTQLSVARKAMEMAGLTYENIAGIGITNQRETTVVWNRNTGKPVYNAIVWQCRRSADYCDELKNRTPDMEARIKEKTGLPIDAYFSGTKLRWILENVEGARSQAEAGELLFGTIETWLVWNLTGGAFLRENCKTSCCCNCAEPVHITDYSNASRTMMFNIHSLEWDVDILEELNIPKSMLPTPVESSGDYGETCEKLFGGPIRICGMAGDQQAALFGQTCFEKGMAKNTYGTGCFLLMNTGEEPCFSSNGLVTTVAWGVGGKVTYALEGSVFVAGAAIQWLRDELEILENSPMSETAARSVEDENGVYVVPAFTGLGAPYWDPYARGAILGLTRGANRNHIIRATLKSLAYQSSDLIEAMEADIDSEMNGLQVDGGACANGFLMQFQADILNKPVIRPTNIETTSLGAAFLAGLDCGYWQSQEDILKCRSIDTVFTPDMECSQRERELKGWSKAVACVRGWLADD